MHGIDREREPGAMGTVRGSVQVTVVLGAQAHQELICYR